MVRDFVIHTLVTYLRFTLILLSHLRPRCDPSPPEPYYYSVDIYYLSVCVSGTHITFEHLNFTALQFILWMPSSLTGGEGVAVEFHTTAVPYPGKMPTVANKQGDRWEPKSVHMLWGIVCTYSLEGIEPCCVGRPVRSLVSMSTELSRFSSLNMSTILIFEEYGVTLRKNILKISENFLLTRKVRKGFRIKEGWKEPKMKTFVKRTLR